jgi:Protein of unknown function (DUF3379)
LESAVNRAEVEEFERNLGIDPRNPARKAEAKALQESGACPDAELRLARALKFEQALDRALALPVPTALQKELLQIAGVSQPDAAQSSPGARRPRRQWLAIAASITMLSLALYGGYRVSTQAPRNALLVQHCADHMMHEPYALLRREVVPQALVERMFAANGFATTDANGRKLSEQLGAVNYLSPCTVNGKNAIHMVVQTEAGPVTVLVMHEQATDGASESRVGPAMIRVSPLQLTGTKAAAMVLVAESGVSVDKVEARFLQALNS